VAEVARVAVGEIHIKAETEEVDEQVSAMCELWHALLTERLSEFESIDILEREYLSTILKELELSLTDLSDPNSNIQAQKLIGVDFLVLSELVADKSTYTLSSRLVSVKDGSVEKDFNIKIDVNDIYEQVNIIAAEIKRSAINYFDTSNITHLIAIADFENKSSLSRNDWMETSVPRKLRRALKRLPCVRILEREEVDLLLKEVRLSKGGFVQKAKDTLEKNANCKRRFLITGSYDEYQPLDQKSRLEFSINIREIDLQKDAAFKTDFEISEFDTRLKHINDLIAEQIFKASAKIKGQDANRFEEENRKDSEAESDLDKALQYLDEDGKEALLYIYEDSQNRPIAKAYLNKVLHRILDPNSNSFQEGQNEYESKVCLNKAFRLMGVSNVFDLKYDMPMLRAGADPNRIRRLRRMRGMLKLSALMAPEAQRAMWNIRSENYFSPSRSNRERGPARHANISRVVRYLKTAIMLDDNNLDAKELLCVLLVDRQISDSTLAKELAQEVAARYPNSNHQKGALLFLIELLKDDTIQKKQYLDLFVDNYPGHYMAQKVINNRLSLTERVEKMRKEFQKRFTPLRLSLSPSEANALRYKTDRYFVEWEMREFFRRTQYSIEYADFGEEVIEKMVQDFPQAATLICTWWAYLWNAPPWNHEKTIYKNNTEKTIYWCGRGLALFERKEELHKKFQSEYHAMKSLLGQNLFKQEEYELALDALKEFVNIKPPYGDAEKVEYLRYVCMYKLGRYEEALAGFEQLGQDKANNSEKWANECRRMLSIAEKISPTPQNWKEGTWIRPKIPLSRKGWISTLTLDGDDIWIGTKPKEARPDWEGLMVRIEQNPRELQRAKQAGFLIRYNTRTKKTTKFEVGKEISCPWITCVHAQNKYVWVGTYGGGLDIYDKDTNTWSNISENDGLPSNYIQCFAGDDSYLWIGTGRFGKGAVAKLDLKTKNLHTFLPRDYPNQPPPPTCHINGMKTAGNFLWCALYRNGVAMYDKEKNLWAHISTVIRHIAVFEDKVWFSSSSFNTYDCPEERALFSSKSPAKFRLERRSVFSCEINGDNWQRVSIKDGLSEAEIYAMDSDLLLGTYILKNLYLSGSVGYNYAYKLPCGLWVDSEVTKVLPLSANEIWIGTSHGVKILKMP